MTVLILGAGVDRTAGLDMPLAKTLIPEVSAFIEGDGKEIEKTLRRHLPNLRFSFRKLIKDAVDNIVNSDHRRLRELADRLEGAKHELGVADTKIADVLVRLLEKVSSFQRDVQLDDETFQMIKDAFGEEFSKEVTDSDIIEINKVSLSESFKLIMTKVLMESLRNKDNALNRELSDYFLDMENLLVETFLGFFNRKDTDIKKYLDISWIIWAYLLQLQQKALGNDSEIPFYSAIPTDFKVVTLNYTSFIERVLPKEQVVYFHGSLGQYLRMDIRDLIDIENLDSTSIIDFLDRELGDNLDFGTEKYVIPAIIPPLKIKPVLSNRNIEEWARALGWLNNADKIIIIGYSFNKADEHFNDMIRKNKNKQITIIDPGADRIRNSTSVIFGYQPSDYTTTTYQGKLCYKCQNIKFIKAFACEIDMALI